MTIDVDCWEAHPEALDPTSGSLIETETIDDVEPLNAQFAAETPKTVPDKLHDCIFGQPNAADPKLQTYAIIDGAKVTNLLPLLETSELEFGCLFNGAAFDEMKEVAPWVVRLEVGNTFTRNLFSHSDAAWHSWRTCPNVYVRSAATLDDMRRHFRKFTRVQDEAGKWFYFRFWEPLVMSAYGGAIAHKPQKVARWFGKEIEQIIVPALHRDQVQVMSAPNRDEANASGKFLLEDDERAALRMARMDVFLDRLADHCAANVADCADWKQARRREVVRHVVSLGRKSGFRSELAIANYTEASLHFGRPLEGDAEMLKIIRRPYQADVEKSEILLGRAKG